MLPHIFGRIDTYYVLWGAALVLLYFWTLRRSVRLYGLPREDASDVLWWVFLGALAGACLGGYLQNWERFAEEPARLLRFWEMPVSSGAGFVCGGLLGLWRARRLAMPVSRFAEASSVPIAFTLAIGRLGCFAAGCCRGLPTDSPLGVRFPDNPGASFWPSQLFESAAALLIGVVLSAAEKYRRRRGLSSEGALLFPIFLIAYGGYRLAFDFLRGESGLSGLNGGQYVWIAAVAVGILWLVRTAREIYASFRRVSNP